MLAREELRCYSLRKLNDDQTLDEQVNYMVKIFRTQSEFDYEQALMDKIDKRLPKGFA